MTGNHLKQKRAELGISQQELAIMLNLAVSTVARWEQMKDNEISNSTMLELALKGLEIVEKAA